MVTQKQGRKTCLQGTASVLIERFLHTSVRTYICCASVCVYVCGGVTSLCIQLYMHVCAFLCGGQGSTSTAIPQVPPHLFFQEPSGPSDLSGPTPQCWDYTPSICTCVLGIRLESLASSSLTEPPSQLPVVHYCLSSTQEQGSQSGNQQRILT